MMNPNIVFETDTRRGLVARSGWEQEEARAVLRDLGWEWQEDLHALVPPADTPDIDAGVQAVEELHLHGYRTGYMVGRFGAVRLTLDRAEQVFVKAAAAETPGLPASDREGGRGPTKRPYPGGDFADPVGPEAPAAPAF